MQEFSVDYQTVRGEKFPRVPRTIVLSKVIVVVAVVTVIYLTIVNSVKSIPYHIYMCEHC